MSKLPPESMGYLVANHYIFNELWRILEIIGDGAGCAGESSRLSIRNVNEIFLKRLSMLFRPYEIYTFFINENHFEHTMAYKEGEPIKGRLEGFGGKIVHLIETAERFPFEPLGKIETDDARVWVVEILSSQLKQIEDVKSNPCVVIIQNNGESLGLKKFTGLSMEDMITPPHLKAFGATYDTCLKLALSFKSLRESEDKRILARIETAQRYEALGVLASGIAHDFNNILTPILGYSDIIIDGIHHDDETPRQDAKEIKKAGIRAKALVKQILAFCRGTDQTPKPVALKEIVKEVLKLLRATLPAAIEIRCEFLETNPVLANPTSVYQILMNLCTNAYHAMMDKGGVLEVTLAPGVHNRGESALIKGNHLTLSVRDTGEGMDQSVISRMFEFGFTTKTGGKGTGFGLYLVKDIVHALGGKIVVESEKGLGSAFHIHLPTVEAAAEEAPDEVGSPPVGDEWILFVDDEMDLVNLGAEILRSFGYQVLAINSSDDALMVVSRKPDKFDLVVTDMNMPGMTGLKLSMALRKIRPDLPIVLTTGFSDRIMEKDARFIGIREFIMKPFDRGQLAWAVRRALDGKGRGGKGKPAPRINANRPREPRRVKRNREGAPIKKKEIYYRFAGERNDFLFRRAD